MARRAQGIGAHESRLFLWFSLRAALCLAAAGGLAGCGTSGFSLESAVPDRSIVTASIPEGSAGTGDAVRSSDEATIRNAVSSAVVEDLAGGSIGWANAQTGSRGTIRDVAESRSGSALCRNFVASRESFDGVYLYRGSACLGQAGIWTMKSFDRIE